MQVVLLVKDELKLRTSVSLAAGSFVLYGTTSSAANRAVQLMLSSDIKIDLTGNIKELDLRFAQYGVRVLLPEQCDNAASLPEVARE